MVVPSKNKIIIESNSTYTFTDGDFIVYCQKALFDKHPYRIRITDWEPEYCLAYIKTVRQHHRWQPLNFKYQRRGHYIFIWRKDL